MTLTQLKTKANTKLTEFWDALAVKQEAYHLKHNNYFQLVVTDPVVDGVDTTFIVKHPHDEAYQVDVDFSFNSPIPFEIKVDTWGMHPSHGYKATCVVELPDGRRFTRSRSLTDTRVRTRDLISGTLENNDLVYSDWYYSGAVPVIETTAWEEIIVEQI